MKDRMNSTFKWFGQHWRGLLMSLAIGGLAIATLGMQVTTLFEGQNFIENQAISELQSSPSTWDRMVNAPYLVPAYYLGKLINDPLLGARLISVTYGLLATVLLFLVLKRWLSTQYAAIGSLIFLTSSWVLAISHQAAPLIMLVITPLAILWGLNEFVRSRNDSFIRFLILLLLLATAAYIPYMFWTVGIVIFIVAIIYKRRLASLTVKQIIISGLAYLALLVPLGISISVYPGQLRELVGIPQSLPSFSEYLQNFVSQFSAIFFYSESFPEIYLGKIALLDAFSSIMLLLGIYYFIKRVPRRRNVSVMIVIASLLILIPLNDPYQIPLTTLIPFIYIFIACGVFELLSQWFSYFPRNPIARNGAVITISILVGITSLYNLQRFYIAWPKATETKRAYMIQSIKE